MNTAANPNQRPAERKFSSAAVEAELQRVAALITEPELRQLFINCYPNTLDTTVQYREIDGIPDSFVITGDIHALWLRDSAAQVWPYLPLVQQDAALGKMIAGLVRRHAQCILIDPYANAFNDGAAESEWQSDHTDMKPELHERKWELDSLCYAIRLAHGYWSASKDSAPFDPPFDPPFDEAWLAAMKLAVATMREQQRKTDRGPYRFTRTTAWQSDTLPCGGWGNPLKPVGLIASMFRPSDDACVYPFLVPSNFFAVASLRQLAQMVTALFNEAEFAAECTAFADEVAAALEQYAVVQHPKYGAIYAFEVDGYGNALMMDDANIPSLLALPYLDESLIGNDVYANTRRFVLSEDNPWFFKTAQFEGNGSPHTLAPMIWPMSIIMRALTSDDDAEIAKCLTMLQHSHAGTYFMHESFDVHNPANFTRSWFAWTNTLFGELIVHLANTRSHLLQGAAHA
ncbi:glycoside hydrolase family 125 protein [Chitinibacter bivalviorum]|uniref:Glycoside hydrolase family 125 protein n=1 Tax=Chitinibacter bivalviorum TaxID=2739434 RepID=A0A7H9BJJ1_9NEIS|nr:glycoside hydrolase family 125 protein [Chitinibacter bivalviorum]QLG88845.1 glycoside hydrolase family 125 protein [Chitinibacter bivalviorum]